MWCVGGIILQEGMLVILLFSKKDLLAPAHTAAVSQVFSGQMSAVYGVPIAGTGSDSIFLRALNAIGLQGYTRGGLWNYTIV